MSQTCMANIKTRYSQVDGSRADPLQKIQNDSATTPVLQFRNKFSRSSMRRITFISIVALVWALTALTMLSVDIHDTKLLAQPAISRDHIAFTYAGDIWVAGLDGQNVRRLTSDIGVESNPRFSPDGKLLAFSGQYDGDGDMDVYVVPVEGGVPKRLDWHPGTDIVQGFTPDGAILFTSSRASFNNRYTQLFTIPTDGGFPEALKIPNASKATYSPDGTRIAYN